MSYLKTLEEFNLASNNFSSSMTLVSASTIFDALSTIPSLKKLNLSRNRLEAWHGTKKFPNLIELYFAFNQVQEEEALLPALETNPNLSIFVITGNPFAANLTESILEKILYDKFGSQGQLINESLNPPSYLRGARTRTAPETSTAF
jgi:Leucine-rich repeat (LRR) protein